MIQWLIFPKYDCFDIPLLHLLFACVCCLWRTNKIFAFKKKIKNYSFHSLCIESIKFDKVK